VTASIVALSDLHLGYDTSILDDPAVQDRVVAEIADLCGGVADRLVLNGDCFEACVPGDAGQQDAAGFPPLMASVSRSFLQKFTDRIKTTNLVIVWGNHDYSLWSRLATSCGVPAFTNGSASMHFTTLSQSQHPHPSNEGGIREICR